MKSVQYINKNLGRIIYALILCGLFLVVSANSVQAQIQVMRVYGSNCVGAQNVFVLTGGTCSASWYVYGGSYTILSQSGNSISVAWNSPTSNAYVSASYSCQQYPYSGSASSSPISITNPVTPSVSISVNANNVCQGTNVTFTASPVNGGSPYYSWRVNGTTVSSGASATFTRAANNGDVVDVVLSSSAPCVSTSTATSNAITMTTTSPSPVSVSVSGSSTICSGSSSSASFAASVTNGGSSPVYTWYKNGSPASDRMSGPPAYVYVPTNPLNNGDRISCRVTSNASCVSNNPATSNEVVVSLTPSTTPTVGISIPKINFCSGESITFGATGSYLTGSSTYVWRLNGSQISTSSSVTLPVTTDGGAPNAFSPGDVVTLDAYGLSGTCLTTTSASASTSGIPFTINPTVTPSVNLNLSTTNLCLPGSITLTAAPTHGGSTPTYAFYIDGTQVASGTSNTYTTSSISAGSHSAYVVMTSNASCRTTTTVTSSTKSFTVASKSTFTANVNGPSQICANQTSSVGFYATVANVTGNIGTVTYQWYKNGSATGVTSNPYITDVAQGTTIYVRATSDYWCVTSPVTSPTYTANLTPTVTPNVSIQIPKITFCTGETITFTASGSHLTGASTYSWKLNGAQFSTASSASLPVSTDTGAPATFSPGDVVTLDVTGLSGTCLTSSSASATTSGIPFTIYPLPTATTNPTGNVVVCSTCSRSITASAGTGYSYQWKFNNTPVAAPAGTANPFTASNAGTYNVEVTANGCKKTSPNIILSKNAKPVANAGPDKTLVLPLNSITLNGSGSDSDGTIVSYAWTKISGPHATLTNANTANLSLSNLVAGTYVFRLTVTDNFGESATDDVTVIVNYPANNYNWRKETTVRISGQTTEAQVQGLAIGPKNVAYQYFDGIGRPMQSVIVQGSPLLKDVVQPVVFDEYGREQKKYLPVVVNETNGYYKPNTSIIDATTGNYKGIAAGFYTPGSNNKIADDNVPYAQVVYENSPDKGILKDYGAGQAWYDPANNVYKPIEYQQAVYLYGTSAGQERVIAWMINGSGLPVRNTTSSLNGGTGYYPTGALIVKVTKDENGYVSREYTDKAGRLILKKVQATNSATDLNSTSDWAQTYYIYDDFGNMRYVLQPELVKTIAASTTLNPAQADLNAFAFQYKFDERQRTVEKKSPGADPLYLVYDKRDRVVLTQDGNQRKDAAGAAKREWTYTKYDELNRPVITGVYTHGTAVDRVTMAGLVSTTNFTESYNGDPATYGYTNTVFPTTNYKVLAVTYYDNYRFRDDMAGTANYGYTANDLTGQEAANADVLGMVTGTYVNVLGTNNYLWNVTYYDHKYRKLQTKSQNHKGGIDRVTHLYDFIQVKETKTVHATASASYAVHKKFDYDHVGRVSKNWHKFNSEPDFVLVSQNEFNELGELVTKKLHSRNGGAFAQNVDYRYTIRGWLDRINDIATPEASDLFSLELKYLQPSSGITPQYNGNITETVWKSAGGEFQSYGYEYDAMNRMIAANFYNKTRPWLNGRYTERIGDGTATRPAYDLNGNIKNLLRYGKKTATTFGLIDDLRYKTWSGNQVLQIDDAEADNTFDDPFREGTSEQAAEYAYDWNGNFKKDANKGLISIEYNHLNLPARVSKSATDYILYTYDAAGRKLAQEVFGSAPKKTEYLGEFVYENNALVFISHEEGRIVADNSAGAPRPWEYQYFIKDHLGNVRVVFSEKKTTSEFKATFETNTQGTEQSTFRNYSRSGFPLFNHTAGTGYTYSQLLNGGNNSQIGLAKSFEVNPGDMVDLEVYAKYEEPTSNNANVNTLLTALVSAFSLGTGGTPLESPQAQSAFNGLFTGGGPWITSSKWEDDAAPKAYLNYILFDQNFQLVDFGFDQVSVSSKQVGATPVVEHDYLNLHVKVKQKGYLYVYLSNEQPVQTNVYFDDMKITYQTGVEQVTDYYPFGATIASLSYTRPGSVANPFGYNGRELQDEMNLGWLDYGLRMYMPDIGRWGAQDPYSQKMAMVSPYAYSLNNPVLYQDKDGAIPIIPLLIKAGANGAADLFLQVVMNYYFDDKDITVAEAFDNVNWYQVGRSALEGLIPWKTPGGRLGRAAGTAVGDVMVNAFNQGSAYTAEKALKDFAMGFLGDLAGGGLGELINKYGAKGFSRGLSKIFGKDEAIEYVWKYVDPQLRGTVFEHMLAETRYKGYTHTFKWSETFPAIDFWKDGKGISLKTTDAKSGFGNIMKNIEDLAKAKEAGHIRGKKITDVELHIGVPEGYDVEDLQKVIQAAWDNNISITIFFIN